MIKTASDIKINWSKIFGFMAKYWHIAALIFILISLVSIRSSILNPSGPDQWATTSMYNYIKQQLTTETKNSNPNLPDNKVNELVDQKFNEVLATQSQQINQQISQIAAGYRDVLTYEYKGKTYVYMGDIDSYFWLRYARNIVEKGSICDSVRGGVCYDDFEFAPLGKQAVPAIHPYVEAYTYKFLQAIGIDLPLMQVGIIVPTIIAVLTALFAFFVGYLIAGRIGSVLLPLLVSFNLIYISRSIGSDNDTYHLIMPLMILTFLFLSFKSDKTWKRILFAALAGISQGAAKFAWEVGWWNIYNAILYAFIMYLGYTILHSIIIKKTVEFKPLIKPLIILGVFIAFAFTTFSLISVHMMSGPMEFVKAPLAPIQFLKFGKAAANPDAWPNVLNTVAEFNPLPFSSIPSQVFSNSFPLLFFIIGVFGILVLFFKELPGRTERYIFFGCGILLAIFLGSSNVMGMFPKYVYLFILLCSSLAVLAYIIYRKHTIDEEHEYSLFTGMVILIWFMGALLATTSGVRFALLIVNPISIAITIGVYVFIDEVLSLISSHQVKWEYYAIVAIFILVVGGFSLSYMNSTSKSIKGFMPNYNQAWDEALIKIRDNSGSDAIINSWWDFGHWFKYTANRGVTLDGATQNNPPLHWLGKALLTDNEDLSRGILRMLDCGSNNAYDELYKENQDPSLSIDILYDVLTIRDAAKAEKRYAELGVKNPKVVASWSHCDAPENFFITSEDMVGKAPVWAHFGSWDFHRAEVAALYIFGASRENIIKNLSKSEEEKKSVEEMYNRILSVGSNDKINEWIAPWPVYYGTTSTCIVSNNSYSCEQGVSVENGECWLLMNGAKKHPAACYFDGQVKRYTDDLATMQGRYPGFAISPTENGSATAILMDYQLVGSMFTRLYYFRGDKLTNFELFDERHSVLGNNIYVWKVKW